MATKKVNIDIIARDKSQQALNKVRGNLDGVKKAVFNVRNALAGLGAGLVIRNLVNTGKEIEGLQVRLKFLFGSAEEGAKAFDKMAKFASKVPFSLQEIQAGSGNLAVVAKDADELANLMEITGNVAAATGLDFRTAAEQIQRSFSAGIGAADLFREKGVRNMLGFQAGATVSIEETREAFAKVFGKGGQFGKATDELAETFEGTLSMIGDKIFNFKRVLLEAGFFEELKNQFGDLDNFLENNARELDKIATSVGKNLANGMVRVVQIGKGLIPTLRQIGSILKSIIDGFMSLPPFIQQTGIIGAVLFGKKGFAAIAGVSFVVDKINTMIKGIKTSMGIFDVTNVEDVQLRIDQIKRQLEELREPDFFSNFGMGTSIDTKKIQELEKELELRQEQLNMAEKLQELERAGFSIARENYIMRNSLTKEQIELNKTILEQFEELNDTALENLKNKLTDINTTIAEGLNAGIGKFSNALSRAIILGEDLGKSFKRMVQDALVQTLAILIEVIIRLGIQKLLNIDLEKGEDRKLKKARAFTRELKIQVALAALLAFLTGGASMGFGGASGGRDGGMGMGGKTRARGGAVQKGQPYLVGEKGAELFIPNSTGQITQSARGTGGMNGVNTVNINVSATDVRGVKELLIDNRSTIVNAVNIALNEKGKEAL